MTLALGFEALLAVLLLLTVFYCWRLDRRLNALRQGQDGMRSAVQDLVNATIKAETCIQGLRANANESGKELDSRITSARRLAADLQRMERHARSQMPSQPNSINTHNSPSLGGGIAGATGARRSSLMDRLREAG